MAAHTVQIWEEITRGNNRYVCVQNEKCSSRLHTQSTLVFAVFWQTIHLKGNQ